MDLKNFEYNFFKHLENNSKDCYKDIDEYKGLIQDYFGERCDIKSIRDFVYNFNIRVIKNDKKEFDVFEGVLKHKLFTNVLYEFRNSEILILACQEGNENALNWLMTMDINTCVQDKNGCTALMYACKKTEMKFLKIVNYLCEHDEKNIQLVDSKGQNAAFYAVENLSALRSLINHGIDINRTNYNYDSLLTYCCRNKIYEPLKVLGVNQNVDPNIFNDEEKTAAFYLIEDEKYFELKYIISKKMNLYFKNSKNETPLSILFKKYSNYFDSRDYDKLIDIIKIIKVIIDKKISIDTAVDEEGNTPFMYFLKYKDWCSIAYSILHCNDIDFSYKNAHGQTATILSLGITREIFYRTITSDCELDMKKLNSYFLKNHTFDRNFVDANGNNLLMYCAYNNASDLAELLLEEEEEKAYSININNEDLMIMCAKLGSPEIARTLINKHKYTDINHQDNKGNTALHYAIQCSDYIMADLLAYNKADLNIKNKEGVSPMDLARNDGKMVKYLKNPVAPYKMADKIKKKKTFKPLRVDLQKKFRESYTHMTALNHNESIYCDTKFYEKSLDIYFITTTSGYSVGYNLANQVVANCGDLFSLRKRNEKIFYLEAAGDILWNVLFRF